MERKQDLQLFAEWKESKDLQLFVQWNYLQNGKKAKITTIYGMQNKKESKNRIYLDTSMATVPKTDELQCCSKDVATPRATKFTSSTRGSYKLGSDNVVYTIDVMVYSCHFSTRAIDHKGFSNQSV